MISSISTAQLFPSRLANIIKKIRKKWSTCSGVRSGTSAKAPHATKKKAEASGAAARRDGWNESWRFVNRYSPYRVWPVGPEQKHRHFLGLFFSFYRVVLLLLYNSLREYMVSQIQLAGEGIWYYAVWIPNWAYRCAGAMQWRHLYHWGRIQIRMWQTRKPETRVECGMYNQ